MNIPEPSKINLLFAGSTGPVVALVLRYGLDRPMIVSVSDVELRELGVSHRKLKNVVQRRATVKAIYPMSL
jgi:hypothetical protein